MRHLQNIFLLMLCSIGCFSANTTYALGLGQTVSYTVLGERLLAEIPILGIDELGNEEVLISIANPDEYKNLHTHYETFHRSLRFTLSREPMAQGKIIITSLQPITEPFLQFVLKITTPKETLLKPTTLLLDFNANKI